MSAMNPDEPMNEDNIPEVRLSMKHVINLHLKNITKPSLTLKL